jgi:flagella basal body P-ring formation protein FlgA
MVINRKKNSVKIYNFDGNFDWLVNARFDFALNLPTLKESVKKGEMIKESDLKFTTVNAKEVIHQQYLLDKKDIIGKVARVNLQSENYIKKKQLTEAVMVKKKSVIDLLYHTQNVKISMNAIALEDGKKDDIIQILNPRSKNNLQGRVVDYNLVKIIN